ncbi:MAG: polysaccharide pyruvyl transferase family protein [Betaproteobacteria bacterium HGW-Betaproteobacteria-5]|jgi:polysaccharide pyruvyl transferase WcaK-like protein|nr:MAG: polysaccharide pyruvyl transferase family protein [Betaproteobacteria bacterium HGW-Betaproteobacteria-5]PKO39474.1 MAG: polysaccharide pyruvyl transferase family protein [Betaproteobacteria bacterium HGW-Betaproteobacteria-6]
MKLLNVGLLWHSVDSANLGVGALTYSQMHLVEQAARMAEVEVKFTIIGWTREGARLADSRITKACQVNGRRLLGLDKSLRQAFAGCDLVLDIGEGDSFSDIYGWKRLAFLIGTKLLASRGGRPLVLSPQTLGPFKHPVAAWLGDLAMRRARAVCSRDALSTAYFQSRKLNKPVNEIIDVAFALPFEAVPRSSEKIRVGINVSGLLWGGGYSGNNQFGLTLDYQATVLELIDYFLEQPNVEVVLVPHVVNAEREAEDDLRASQRIASIRPAVSVAGPFASAMEAKGYIAGFGFFTGARMHACIAAFSSGVPCVPMAYSRKFAGLFNTMNYTHVADCTKETQAQVVSRMKTAFSGREQLREETRRGNEIAQQRLEKYRRLLAELLAEAKHG